MNIIVAPSAGFCFGVKRAVKMAVDASKTRKLSEKLNTLGPIIHNPQVVKSLEEKGVYPVDTIEDNGHNTIIIRSHGVKSDIMESLKSKGLKIIDATCPFVKQAQNYITMAASDGYFIIMVGDKNHPEVQSVISFADKNRFLIINGLDDFKNIPVSEKLALISQTTQDVNFYGSVINEIFKIAKKEIVVFNTICDATKLKQDESKVLASKVDVMIVVGGYNSANTNKLKNICAAIQKNTYHIETEKEVNPEWFIDADMVGITAGASTPDWIIEKVVNTIRQLDGNQKIAM
ncbi:MAG: 4-hydroxy-3-methylbut-2-enyl diphosphate reductase [Deltaproteobacteria bacterium]|jgi:4-hydroxy-3-methylbut-2-enyl diphosphate reductase|nr:4-hydroxy-3-methylbut-2-enyl diphosphate reductase [Deltaproteobacteria bacterium]MCL5880289.1 4-hydroxy-3-methylbut-2-enyl diphosphate reductase [Deltaproteobacteria bacterium]MDA8303977.1 4-hydroxy-3-methylbut-2-enyl diphosphate reductase [Deltaproteobacteria bacterium]